MTGGSTRVYVGHCGIVHTVTMVGLVRNLHPDTPDELVVKAATEGTEALSDWTLPVHPTQWMVHVDGGEPVVSDDVGDAIDVAHAAMGPVGKCGGCPPACPLARLRRNVATVERGIAAL